MIADFIQGYGPEVWHVDYSIEQFPQRGDFWETRVPRPRFLQDWPPEKNQPHTLLEFDYPPGVTTPTLLEMLQQKDSRLETLSNSDPVMAAVASMLLKGNKQQSRLRRRNAVSPRCTQRYFPANAPRDSGRDWFSNRLRLDTATAQRAKARPSAKGTPSRCANAT